MDTQSSSRVFQLLLLLVCRIVIQITDCLKLNATNGLTFSPNTTAKFECEINPYTDGIQEWSVNTIVVAECGFILCDVKNNNQGSYSFTNDINTGMFTFTIYPLTLADDGTVVGCSDGTITEQRTITVTVKEDNGGDGGWEFPWWLILIIVILVISAIIVLIILIKVNKKVSQPDKPEIYDIVEGITEITLRWTKPNCAGDPTLTYLVTYKVKTTNDRPKEIHTEDTRCTIRNLPNETTYVIKVYAINSEQMSEPETMEIKTKNGKPDPPTEFRVADVSKDSITVKWGHGYNGGCQQTFYVVVNKEQHHEVETGDCEYVCSGLSKGTYYNISLMAHNKYGDTYASKSLRVRTLGPQVTSTNFEMVVNTESTVTM